MFADTDIAIVGGGPVGLATAIELRRAGHEVVVVDRSEPPIDKACGEGLMPDGVRVLCDLGVKIGAGDGAALRGIRYLDGTVRAEARFQQGPGLGIRRTVLHGAMVARAAEVGVRMLWGLRVRGITERGVMTARGRLRAEWIVGADGLHSRVRQWAGLDRCGARFRRHGVRRHYRVEPWSDLVEVHWTDDCEAYVTPVSVKEVGIAFLWSGYQADFDGLLGRFPRLKSRLEGAPISSRDRGAGQLERRSRAVHNGRVALVGDAAGYRDAITGEGLSLGFHQAQALSAAITAADLDVYERAVRKLTAVPFLLIRLLLEAERRPWLRRRLIRTLAAEPNLFARLLAVHARETPPRSIGAKGLLRLTRGLLG